MDETRGVITVMLADDEELVRTGLRLILESADDVVVAAEAGDGPAAVAPAAVGASTTSRP